MILDQAAVDRFRLVQLAQLEERQAEEIACPLVARLEAKSFFQELPRSARVAALQRIGTVGQRALELLVVGEVRVVFEKSTLVQRAWRGGVHQGAPRPAAGPAAESATCVRFAARFNW